jgi:ABC-type transport system involved in multi-copper enzyme maturation permease subunit
MPIITLAKFTIRGYIKERILLVVLIFAFLLMVASYVMSPLAVGAQQKIVVDIGLAAIPLFGILLIVLLGAGTFYQEKQHGILKGLLVKPITRAEFVLGKWAGTVFTVILVMSMMAVVYLLVMWLSGAAFSKTLFLSIYLSMFEIALIAAVLSFFSAFTSPVLASFFTICTAASGHLSRDLLAFAERMDALAPRILANAAYFTLPNLGLFNIRQEAVHGLPLPDGFIVAVTIYGLFYTAVLLFLSAFIFRLKEIS